MEPADADTGAGIVNATWAGTAVFMATAIAATVSSDLFGGLGVAVALTLFGIGSAVMLWAFALAVGRSRTDAIGIGGLYFLRGSAPKVVRFRFNLALALQVVTAIATASIRPYTSVAFGVLVPMYGIGMAGLWGARYGAFEPRQPASEP